MHIAGLQKMTLLDYPGRVACTVFLQGCNFRCPFCHNSGLLSGQGQALMSEEELLAFLKKRRGLLDGVCITGGEPTLQKELPQLLRKIKDLGYYVKLDTNGGRPAVLKAVTEAGLADYVAMDIKNSPLRYAETAGVKENMLNAVEQSIAYLLSGRTAYEFRTTVVAELHDAGSIRDMGQWVQQLGNGNIPQNWYLQCYTDRDSVLQAGLSAPRKEQMQQYAEILAPYAVSVGLRGVE